MIDSVALLREQIFSLLSQAGLSRIADLLQPCVEASLILKTQPVADEQIPWRQSKLGGAPDLPREFEWPVWRNNPLHFIAQINLAELPPSEFGAALPLTGLLYFFYATENLCSGDNPSDRGGWRVWYGNPVHERGRVFPGNLPIEFPSCVMTFSPSLSIPHDNSPCIRSLDLSEDELNRYIGVLDQVNELAGTNGCTHRLLGLPDQIQDEDMRLTCEMVSNGRSHAADNTQEAWETWKTQALPAADNWRLLLQIDSDQHADMMWGDAGRLYFWIRREDLQRWYFDATWLVMQCC